MAVTDLTSMISPNMQQIRISKIEPVMSVSEALDQARFRQAEDDLRMSYEDLERAGDGYNELVDSYNAAESAAEQALLDNMMEEKAAEFNAAVRQYNEIGNRYQNLGIISGFSAIDEINSENTKEKPRISLANGIVQGENIQRSKPISPERSGDGLGLFGAAGAVQAAFVSSVLQSFSGIKREATPEEQGDLLKSSIQSSHFVSDVIQDTPNVVKKIVDIAQTPANATPEEQAALKKQRQDLLSNALQKFSLAPPGQLDVVADLVSGKTSSDLLQDQRDFMTNLGKTQIALGGSFSSLNPLVGNILKDSGSEIIVSRDFQTEGFINVDSGVVEINRPSLYDSLAFGSALGIAGAAVGSGAVTGVSGFGNLFARTTPLSIEGSAAGSGAVSGGGALAKVTVGEKLAGDSIAGLSALSLSLSEIDFGIGSILDEYPVRERDENRGINIPGDVGIGGGFLDDYPSRDSYGNNNRNRHNRDQQNWNRSEIDYRGSVGSGYSSRLLDDSLTRNQNRNQNRHRNEYDSLYEFAVLTEVSPRMRRGSVWDEEDSVIANPRKKQKGKKKHFTEKLIL